MNELIRISEFREVLSNYQLSTGSDKILQKVKLVLLVAPSSSGRNTIIRHLLNSGEFYFIVSDTTRQPRTNDGVLEQNGREYWFRSEEDVLKDLQEGNFLEAAIIHNQQVSGISIRELKRASDQGKIAITDTEVAGADNAVALKSDTVAIFVLPPDFDEWQRRIKNRGSMDALEYKRRMQSACNELEIALNRPYYKFVINDNIESAAEQITQIVKTGQQSPEQQAAAHELAESLLAKTRKLLASS